MAIEYTVKINEVRVASQGAMQDVVKEVGYTVTGTEGACSFSLPNTIKIADPDASNFVPFASLTEQTVIEWVEASDLSSVKAHIAYVVAKEVEKAALEAKPMPWVPAPEEPSDDPAAAA